MSNITDVISTDDLLAYLGIDYTDDTISINIERAIKTADGDLRESVGDDYPVDHPLTPELALLYASASYDQRDLSANELKRANDIALKLRLFMRRRSNESTL